MNIVFDFEISETTLPQTEVVEMVLTTLKKFVRQRLHVLESELKAYPDATIVINVFGTLKDLPLGFAILNVSERLEERIRESLTERDFVFLVHQIETQLSKL